ncbi:MAG: DASS family sodium-coupled anion symporter [Halanaeroarchaeum sp.]
MATAERYTIRQRFGYVAGPASFLLVRYAVPGVGGAGAGNVVFATAIWMATWWITEAVAIPVTSLLPVVVFLTTGVASAQAAAAPYADPVVFLFLGGFLLALTIERWGVHRRVALTILARVGGAYRRLVLAVLLTTAFLSMWLSNTAAATLMLPIGLALVDRDGAAAGVEAGSEALQAGRTPRRPGTGIFLAIAYGASIGTIATIVGTPANAILVGVARSTLGIQIGFLQWMAVGVPVTATFLVVAWVVILALVPRPEGDSLGNGDHLAEARTALGPMDRAERRTVAVFVLVVLGWLLRPSVLAPLVPAVTDATVAVVGTLLFVVPVDWREGTFLLDWETALRVPWGVLLLFGGGFSLAAAVHDSGLDRWIADALGGLGGVDPVLVVGTIILVIVFLTEVTSNSATATVFVPLVASLAVVLAVPALPLMVGVALAASFAFMLPVATPPPNAVVFGSGQVSVPQMARVGLVLNLLGTAFLVAVVLWWVPLVFPG